MQRESDRFKVTFTRPYNLISYGQSNIILLIINIFSYISVILELILDLNLGKIQLQFTAT